MIFRYVAAAILSFVSAGCLKQKRLEAQTTLARSQLKMLSEALELHKLTKRNYPQTLDALADDGIEVPKDPWERPFVYEATTDGTKYDMFCVGPDGKAGTADDVKLPK